MSWEGELKKAGFLKNKTLEQELPSFRFEFTNIATEPPYVTKNEATGSQCVQTLVAVHTDSQGTHFVTMLADEWFNLVKEAGLTKTVFCPDCKSSNISPNGHDEKSRQKYLCNNAACERVSFRE